MKKFLGHSSILVLILVASLFVLVSCGSKSDTSGSSSSQGGSDPEEQIVIKYSHVQGISTPTHQAAEWLKNYLEENSDGRVTMEIYPSGQLYDDSTEIDAISAGNIDMISTQASKLTSLDPDMQCSIVPYLFSSAEEMLDFYSDPDVQDLIFQKLDSAGIEVLGAFYSGDMYLWTNNGVAINKLEDLKGLQMRETASPMTSAMYSALGTNLVSISYSELYTGMQNKVADACTTTIDGVTGIQLQEVLTNASNIKHQFTPYLIQFNAQKFNSYPEDVQALIREGIAKASEYQLELVREVGEEGMALCTEAGLKYNEMSDSEIERLKALWDEVCADYLSDTWKQALDVYRAK